VVTEVQHLDNVRIVLVPGGGGIFVIKLDGSVIYDKSQFNRFPLRGEILALIS
jgi:predicted Rdx family selenoprotein